MNGTNLKYGLLYIGMAFMAFSCHPSGPEVHTGDLLFQAGKLSEMSEAIVAATEKSAKKSDSKTEFEPMPAFTHVGIAVEKEGAIRVLEAAKGGVRHTPLKDFLQKSQFRHGNPMVVVMRLRDTSGVAAAVRRAEEFVGQPYDYSYLPDNGKMYCSELVYESYRKKDGAPRFTAHPMRFRTEDGTLPRFWKELFEQLGEPVPEGVPGTNPEAMSHEAILMCVGRFF